MFAEVDGDAAGYAVEIDLDDATCCESDTYLNTELVLAFGYRWYLELDVVHACDLYFVALVGPEVKIAVAYMDVGLDIFELEVRERSCLEGETGIGVDIGVVGGATCSVLTRVIGTAALTSHSVSTCSAGDEIGRKGGGIDTESFVEDFFLSEPPIVDDVVQIVIDTIGGHKVADGFGWREYLRTRDEHTSAVFTVLYASTVDISSG